MIWTDDAVTTLKRLWRAGQSAGQIAGEFGGDCNRNMVISKVHRLGLTP